MGNNVKYSNRGLYSTVGSFDQGHCQGHLLRSRQVISRVGGGCCWQYNNQDNQQDLSPGGNRRQTQYFTS